MKRLVWMTLLLCIPRMGHGQLWDKMCRDEYHLDTVDARALKLEFNTLSFFRDNEYDSGITRGYSLPGTWLQPKMTYNPIAPIHVELGAHIMVFDGTNKYPNYAYHDIAAWKGEQYQHGAHVVPWFRAQAQMKHLILVMGDIYGAQNHGLIDPIFNPEQNISADPEMGFQLLLDRRHVHLDTWLNWQSYIFEQDTHQEAFTVGLNAHLLWSRPSSRLRWSTPIQLLIQHRGGEQDISYMGVQTLSNASLGVRLDCTPSNTSTLTALTAEANALAHYQQKGHLWPWNTGVAVHGAVGATLWDRLGLRLGYMEAPRQYANLYGSPFLGTLSIKEPGRTFQGMHTAYLRTDYTHTFSPAYKLGAEMEAFSAHSPGEHDMCFSFGIYLRVSPSLLLKRF